MGKATHDDFVTEIASKSEDFPRWYTDVVRRAELADYSPVKGCMVIRPYGYGLWENARDHLDARIKATGHQNAYFPLFIPESLLQKEADHVEGFAPEVAWVTHGGKNKLEERLAVRPTSEAIICSMYAKWIRSWRDLPVLINQWANVVRWEKVTRFFLRTTEFLWQEGHTAHATADECEEEARKMLGVYTDFLHEDLAIPVVPGIKTDKEKFAGADHTYTVEALMSDGRALQAGTSHNLGQNFAKAFDIRFEDQNQQLQSVWQTSWGMTTRVIGALIMTHGDDNGLILPPRVAPYQVVIVPIAGRKGNDYEESVLPAAIALRERLQEAGVRVFLDDRAEHTPGWKYNEWELRGVPLRAEIGPRDVQNEQMVFVRRDNRAKEFAPLADVGATATRLLEELQHDMLERAHAFVEENTHAISSYDEFREQMAGGRGFLRVNWSGDRELEERIQQETSATIRCLLLDTEPDGPCFMTGKPAEHVALFAKAY